MAALATLPACGPPRTNGPADTFYLDFHMPPGSHVRGAIVFMVDGVNSEIFNRMLEAGELPNFQKYFVDRGLYAPHAFASTPTVTLANETSLVTGLYPGHHDITGVNWFDRNTLIWRDYEKIPQKNKLDGDYIPTNIYEQFPDEMTWSIFFQPHRGTTKFVEDAVTGGSAYFIGQYELVDRLTLSRFKLLMKISREVGRFPAVTYVYLLSPDFTAYHFVQVRRSTTRPCCTRTGRWAACLRTWSGRACWIRSTSPLSAIMGTGISASTSIWRSSFRNGWDWTWIAGTGGSGCHSSSV